MSSREEWTLTERAAYEMVHSIGTGRLAQRRRVEPRTISNEVNAYLCSNKLGLEDAIDYELTFNRADILHAHARRLNHLCAPLPCPHRRLGDASLFERFTAWQGAMGRTVQHIHDAFDPDSPGGAGVSRQEAERIATAGYHHMTQFITFLEEIKALQEVE